MIELIHTFLPGVAFCVAPTWLIIYKLIESFRDNTKAKKELEIKLHQIHVELRKQNEYAISEFIHTDEKKHFCAQNKIYEDLKKIKHNI